MLFPTINRSGNNNKIKNNSVIAKIIKTRKKEEIKHILIFGFLRTQLRFQASETNLSRLAFGFLMIIFLN